MRHICQTKTIFNMINENYKYEPYLWDEDVEEIVKQLNQLVRKAKKEGLSFEQSTANEIRFYDFLDRDVEGVFSCMFDDYIGCYIITEQIRKTLKLSCKRAIVFDVCMNAYNLFSFDKDEYIGTHLFNMNEQIDEWATEFIKWYEKNMEMSFEDRLIVRYTVAKIILVRFSQMDGRDMLFYGASKKIIG